MKKFSTLNWWQLALLSLAASALGGLASFSPKKQDRKLYTKKLKQAPWAPPAWLFGPAWTINNYFLLVVLQKIINSELPQRKKLLALQAMIWVIFFSFGYIYFNKKSAVLASIWTMSDMGLALASFLVARKADSKIAAHYLPLLTWTAFASTLANYQALKNPDPLLHTQSLGKYLNDAL